MEAILHTNDAEVGCNVDFYANHFPTDIGNSIEGSD